MNVNEYPSWEEVAGRLHRRMKVKAYRGRLSTAAKNWEEAERIRRFLAYLTAQTCRNPELARKAERLNRWAERYLRRLDPVAYNAESFFCQMESPVPPPTDLEVMGHL